VGFFKDRAEAVEINADEAVNLYRAAADAKKRGDTARAETLARYARLYDETATRFADGDHDDVVNRGR
jgi:hypothetical protein